MNSDTRSRNVQVSGFFSLLKLMEDILKQVIDTKCSVLRDYLNDLEEDLKKRNEQFAQAQLLESPGDEIKDLADAVIKGVNDHLYRTPIGYLESEITKTKYEYSVALAELMAIDEPESAYDIERIKNIPIKDFISRFTTIKRNNQAICPIHREKTPSLYIYERTNSWFCFGHGSGGSVIDFMMQLNNYTLKEALNDLSKLI